MHILDCLEGIDAVPCYGYCVSYHKTSISIPYPQTSDPPEECPEGRSFHHGRFIQKLRNAAKSTPNVRVVETRVTEMIRIRQEKYLV